MHFFVRLWHDFWPLDFSPVGPNLLASLVLFGLAVLYSEFRLLRKLEKHHVGTREVVHDMIKAALHPTEHVEEHVAEDVVEKLDEKKEKPK